MVRLEKCIIYFCYNDVISILCCLVTIMEATFKALVLMIVILLLVESCFIRKYVIPVIGVMHVNEIL